MSKDNLVRIQPKEMTRGKVEPKSNIIAVGGGKGGVGKSFVSTSIAIFLANLGFRTTIIDLDLGAANVHTSLGEGLPKQGLSSFLKDETSQLADFAVGTKFRNLKFISGCNDEIDMADMNILNRSRLMSSIFNYESDFTILDLSAGTHRTTVDFFLMAKTPLIVFTPEPSSIENAYRFMKAAYFRRIKRLEKQLEITDITSKIMADPKAFNVKTPADLISAVQNEDTQKGEMLSYFLNRLQFQVILNQSRTYRDAELGHSIESVAKKFFGVNSQYIGHIDHDNAVWQSLRKHKPLLLEYPHSRLYAQILQIAKKLAHDERSKKSA